MLIAHHSTCVLLGVSGGNPSAVVSLPVIVFVHFFWERSGTVLFVPFPTLSQGVMWPEARSAGVLSSQFEFGVAKLAL